MIDQEILRLPKIKQMMGLLAGLAVLQALSIIGQAWFLSKVITNLWSGQSLLQQVIPLGIFFLSFLVRHGITWLKDKWLDQYAVTQAAFLRKSLLKKVFELGPQVVQQQGTGNVTTMALDGVTQVENYIHLILSKVMNMMILPWLILLVIFYLDTTSGIILLIVFPLIIIFMIVLGYAAQAKADRQYKSFQFLSNHFIDSLRGIDTLKLFGLSRLYGKSIYKTSENFRKATMSTLKIAILSTFALDFFTTLSIAIVAVFLGLRLLNGGILLFPALTVLVLAPEYFLPVRDFANDYHATLDGKNAVSAIREILDQPTPVFEQKEIPTWSEKNTLKVNHLAVNYEEKEALKEIEFSVTGFKKIGIIGMSGSGKSTLINALSGFQSLEKGSLFLNDQQIPSFSQKDWQKQLLYIPQTPYVFQLSLRENIAFYTPNVTDEEILKAIEVVGLTSLVADLPEGLDTQIGNGSRPLSGGQAQRIALARAFLDKTRHILLFDEPTAHLDIETEVELKEKMLPLLDNHLVFFATHRLHWMRQMDEILVLEKGQIVEQGSFEELTARKGNFYNLTQQMRREEVV